MLTLMDSLRLWLDAPEHLKFINSQYQEVSDIRISELAQDLDVAGEDQVDSTIINGDVAGRNRDINSQAIPTSSTCAVFQANDTFAPPTTCLSTRELNGSFPRDGWEALEPPIPSDDASNDMLMVSFGLVSPDKSLPLLNVRSVADLQIEQHLLDQSDAVKQSTSGALSSGHEPELGPSPFGIECPWDLFEEL